MISQKIRKTKALAVVMASIIEIRSVEREKK